MTCWLRALPSRLLLSYYHTHCFSCTVLEQKQITYSFMSRELVRLGALPNVLHGRVNHAVNNARHGKDAANDGAQLRQKVKEGAPRFFHLDHDWTQVVEKIHARQRALILDRLLMVLSYSISEYSGRVLNTSRC